MVSADGTQEPARFSRPTKTANMDSSNTAPVKVKMLTSHGGDAQRSDIFKLMMETGAFDGEIRDYALKNNLLAPSAETANGVEAEAAAVAPARRVSLELVDSAEEMAAIHAKRKSDREVAEKPSSTAQAAVGGGVESEAVTADSIEGVLGIPV